MKKPGSSLIAPTLVPTTAAIGAQSSNRGNKNETSTQQMSTKK
jgi:hypothetical protein